MLTVYVANHCPCAVGNGRSFRIHKHHYEDNVHEFFIFNMVLLPSIVFLSKTVDGSRLFRVEDGSHLLRGGHCTIEINIYTGLRYTAIHQAFSIYSVLNTIILCGKTKITKICAGNRSSEWSKITCGVFLAYWKFLSYCSKWYSFRRHWY